MARSAPQTAQALPSSGSLSGPDRASLRRASTASCADLKPAGLARVADGQAKISSFAPSIRWHGLVVGSCLRTGQLAAIGSKRFGEIHPYPFFLTNRGSGDERSW